MSPVYSLFACLEFGSIGSEVFTREYHINYSKSAKRELICIAG